MADFINTIDALGDDAVIDSIISRTIPEFADDKVTVLGERIFSGCTSLRSVNLPNVTHYRSHALSGCTALTDVSLPELVDFVDNSYAQGLFHGCAALQALQLPKLKRVYGQMFFGCSNLSSLDLPVVESVGSSAFENCKSLTIVDFPKLTSIVARAFFGCSTLKAVVLRSTAAVCSLANAGAFSSTNIEAGTGYIYVPAALIDQYKTATNWSTFADQFRKLEEWTVDGTVTGALDIENRHMVRFFNSDGTLLGYQIVATGATATYSGTPVYPDDSSWKFNGFMPNPTNVAEDMDCYAQYQEPFSLETASWARISEISNEGTAANYMNVGDTKSVYLNGTMGTLALDTTLYVYVIGINHNSEVEGSGIHFGTFKDANGNGVALVDDSYGAEKIDGTISFNMNHWGKALMYGGWAACDTRYDILGSTNIAPAGYGSIKSSDAAGYDASITCATVPVQNTLMSCLPADLRAVLKPITKWSDNVGTQSRFSVPASASIDYLPLPSEFEVWGERSVSCADEENHQKQYDYYAVLANRTKYMHNNTREIVTWWSRSVFFNGGLASCGACCTQTQSTAVAAKMYDFGWKSYGIAPIFMV